MPNIGGPGDTKRKILWGVVQSTLLYAAPIWSKVLRIERYKGLLAATQRKMLLRVGHAYRTVSVQAIQVVTGIPPIDLLVVERTKIWEADVEPLTNYEVRRDTVGRWQARWEENRDTAQWTKRLIHHISTWLEFKFKLEFKKINYWMTQFLTGHGSFRTFTKKIGKDQIDACRYCEVRDSPEHTFFHCPRWEGIRRNKWGDRRGLLTADNIIDEMMSSQNEW